MDSKLPAVGRSIYIEDKKSNSGQWYTVVAHVDERTAKLKSETTGKSKTYKLPKKTKNFESTPQAAQKIVPSWDELNESIGGENAQRYRMSDSFDMKTAIDHPKFGIGFVLSRTDRTIEAVFQEGIKQLIHNRD